MKKKYIELKGLYPCQMQSLARKLGKRLIAWRIKGKTYGYIWR